MYKGIFYHKDDFIGTAVDLVAMWFRDSNKEDLTKLPTEQEWILSAEYAVMISKVNAIKSLAEDYPHINYICEQIKEDENKYMNKEKSIYYSLSSNIANLMSEAEKDPVLNSDIRYLVFTFAIHLCRWQQLNRALSEPEKVIFENEPKVNIDYNIKETEGVIKDFLKKIETTEYDPMLIKKAMFIEVMAAASLILWGADDEFEKKINEEYQRRLEAYNSSRLAAAKKSEIVKCLVTAVKEYINYKISRVRNIDIHYLINDSDFYANALMWCFFYKLYGETGKEIEKNHPQYKEPLQETTGTGLYIMLDEDSYVDEEKLFNIFGTMLDGAMDEYPGIVDIFEFNTYISVYAILYTYFISGKYYEASKNGEETLKGIEDGDYSESMLTLIGIGLYFKHYDNLSSLLYAESANLENEANSMIEEQKRLFISKGLCQYCGGEFKGLFKKVCVRCNRQKDY